VYNRVPRPKTRYVFHPLTANNDHTARMGRERQTRSFRIRSPVLFAHSCVTSFIVTSCALLLRRTPPVYTDCVNRLTAHPADCERRGLPYSGRPCGSLRSRCRYGPLSRVHTASHSPSPTAKMIARCRRRKGTEPHDRRQSSPGLSSVKEVNQSCGCEYGGTGVGRQEEMAAT
jgi:hypothetical protein